MVKMTCRHCGLTVEVVTAGGDPDWHNTRLCRDALVAKLRTLLDAADAFDSMVREPMLQYTQAAHAVRARFDEARDDIRTITETKI
jgi:hypothetical protein